MKKVLSFLFLLVVLAPVSIFAQAKFGHINKQELISKMPATVTAKKSIEDYGKKLEEQQAELQKEFQTKYQAYMALREDAKANKAILQTKEEELKSLQERAQKFQQTANEDFQKQSEATMKPIIEKVDVAIKAVAAEGKFSYVFDTSLGLVLFATDADDITAQVKKKLGIL